MICELKRRGGQVPEEIAMAGFNNDPISRVVDPNLTTIHYPGREMGEIAAKTLIDQLDKDDKGRDVQTILLKHKLIVRKSSSRK